MTGVDALLGVMAVAVPAAVAWAILDLQAWNQPVPLVMGVLVIWGASLVVVVRRPDLEAFRCAFAVTMTVLLAPAIFFMGVFSLCALADPKLLWFLPATLALLVFVFWLMRTAFRDGSR